MAVDAKVIPTETGEFPYAYQLWAGSIWAVVMYLHEYHFKNINRSMAKSMTYLYKDSDKWPVDARSLTEWLWNSAP